MDYTALITEITADPAGIGYAGKTAEEIVVLMNSATVQAQRNVPLDDLQALLMSTVVAPAPIPVWWVLKSAAKTDALAEMAFDYFSSRLKAVDTTLPVVQSVLGGLEAAGVIDATVRSAIDALAVINIPRGEFIFGRVPNVLEVQLAMMGG